MEYPNYYFDGYNNTPQQEPKPPKRGIGGYVVTAIIFPIVGALLAKKTGKTLYDTDVLTATREEKTVREIFLQDGEKAFRTAEDKTVRDLSGKTGCIIATGGGTVLNAENVRL